MKLHVKEIDVIESYGAVSDLKNRKAPLVIEKLVLYFEHYH